VHCELKLVAFVVDRDRQLRGEHLRHEDCVLQDLRRYRTGESTLGSLHVRTGKDLSQHL
jgi:hypothetical protein